jgi:hypothetical protein
MKAYANEVVGLMKAYEDKDEGRWITRVANEDFKI